MSCIQRPPTIHTRVDTRLDVRTFIFAGMDTTSNALARILHMLAKHPEVQHVEIEKARRENEEIPYDMLKELPYLDAVCPETIETECTPLRGSGRHTESASQTCPGSIPFTNMSFIDSSVIIPPM